MSISLPSSSMPLSAAVTRILALSGFPPELKTRDIHSAFAQWENDKGGFKIKWIDDTSALVVFNDATVAKRAYLQTLLSPPPLLSSPTSTQSVQIRPYDGPDAQAIISNVNSRTTNPPPRANSGSNGGNGGNGNAHNSRASFSIPNGAPGGAGHIRAASMVAAIPTVGGHTLSNSASLSNIAGSGTGTSRWANPGKASAVAALPPAAINTTAAPAVASTTGSGTSPTLPSLPYQPTLNSLINSSLNSGSALSTSPPVEIDPASLSPASVVAASAGPPRVGDPGRRMVAGALGVRHPSLRRASPPRAGGVAAEVAV